MEKEIKINEVYTLTVGDLDGMLNDFLSDLGVDEDAITGDQVDQLAAKLIDRFLFESNPSKWDLKDNSLQKTLQKENKELINYYKSEANKIKPRV